MNERYSKEETIAMVAEHDRWFQPIYVGHGITTPSPRNSPGKLQNMQMPADLRGWTVLDIGANDGYFSFEAEERGAKRVLATDSPHWNGDVEYYGKVRPRKDHFETARELRGSSVEDRTISVYDMTREEFGGFDLVMMLGVLYHLVHPTIGLERAVQLADKLVIIETALHVDNMNEQSPTMRFTPSNEGRDPTNWWYPNSQCVMDLMFTFGCSEVVALPRKKNYGRATFHGFKT